MIISGIVAKGKNNEIGKDNDLPWRLPSDLKYFKKHTSGHFILLGRKNFESIGRALPNRVNIVVTRDKHWYRSDLEIFNSIEEGIDFAKENGAEHLFIIGGGNIYEQTMPYCDKLYLTEVEVSIPDADVFFPELEMEQWTLDSEEHHLADEKNQYNFCFKVYSRK